MIRQFTDSGLPVIRLATARAVNLLKPAIQGDAARWRTSEQFQGLDHLGTRGRGGAIVPGAQLHQVGVLLDGCAAQPPPARTT